MKLIYISLVCLILAACQTSGSTGGVGKGDVNVFEIPAEMSRIVIPGVDAPRTVEIIEADTQVVELAQFGPSSVRYKTAPERLLRPLNIKEFTETVDGFIRGYNSIYTVPPTRVDLRG